MRKVQVTIPVGAAIGITLKIDEKKERELLEGANLARWDIEDNDLQLSLLDIAEEEIGQLGAYNFRLKRGEVSIGDQLDWENAYVDDVEE